MQDAVRGLAASTGTCMLIQSSYKRLSISGKLKSQTYCQAYSWGARWIPKAYFPSAASIICSFHQAQMDYLSTSSTSFTLAALGSEVLMPMTFQSSSPSSIIAKIAKGFTGCMLPVASVSLPISTKSTGSLSPCSVFSDLMANCIGLEQGIKRIADSLYRPIYLRTQTSWHKARHTYEKVLVIIGCKFNSRDDREHSVKSCRPKEEFRPRGNDWLTNMPGRSLDSCFGSSHVWGISP